MISCDYGHYQEVTTAESGDYAFYRVIVQSVANGSLTTGQAKHLINAMPVNDVLGFRHRDTALCAVDLAQGRG